MNIGARIHIIVGVANAGMVIACPATEMGCLHD